MKRIFQLVLAIIIGIQFESIGQSNFEDVTYLKNGSIVRGLIIEQIPNKSIKIQTRDGNVFVFSLDEIEKITKETEFKGIGKTDYKSEGFINFTELSFCPGVGKKQVGSNLSVPNKDYSFGIRTINGYQANSNFSVGIGIGFDKYEKESFMPITFDLRYSILSGKVSPIVIANFGYSVGLNDYAGGPIINPSIGFRIFISKSIAYLFSIGYKWQSREYYALYKERSNQPFYSYEMKSQFYQFVTFSTGLSF
jgi:hypothetical protein